MGAVERVAQILANRTVSAVSGGRCPVTLDDTRLAREIITALAATPAPAEPVALVEWRAKPCPSCDDHGGHGREWSIWAGDVRLAHGLYYDEAATIVRAYNRPAPAFVCACGGQAKEWIR